jgi:hypothetical protein
MRGAAEPDLMTVAAAVERIVGPDLPIAIRAYDGNSLGPPDAQSGPGDRTISQSCASEATERWILDSAPTGK